MSLPAGIIYKAIRIKSIMQETNDIKTFVLEATDDTPIAYKAGQFITFISHRHDKEERRSFSISSSPALHEPVSITVKRVPNGFFSRLLIDTIKEGDILETTGAAGLFILPDNTEQYNQIFFLAAGIGITPILSLLKTVLYTQPHMHVVLIYSNRNKEETVFYDELQQLQEAFKDRFLIQYLFSSSFNLSRARLSKLLLPTLLKEYGSAEKEKTLFYVCGPFSYMRMVLITLEEEGVPEKNVKRENFNTEIRPAKKLEPPDKSAHNVTIIAGNNRYSFPVQYPDTILQAAKKKHIALPYSCEVGRCGSCAAICSQGQVWLSNNEVLTDDDIKHQRILTCVAHPIYSDVIINI